MTKQPDQSWRQWVMNNSLPKMEATPIAEPAAGFTPGPANPQPHSQISVAPSNIGNDALEHLPSAAADKLRQLRQRFEDAHALTVPFEQKHTAGTERMLCEARLKRLTDPAGIGGFNLNDDHVSVISERKKLASLAAECKRLDDIDAVRSATWREIGQTLRAVEDWLKQGKPAGTALEDFDGPQPTLTKGETNILDAIENRRRKVRELKADLNRISSACFPSAHCKQRAREQIEALAQRGAISVSKLVEFDGEIEFAMTQVQAMVHNAQPGAVAFHEAVDVVGLAAWLHKDALIAALDREIASEADDKSALTHEARQQQEAVVQGDLLAVERDESTLVWRAMHERLPVDHRADCAPQAILQCMIVTAPRVGGNGSSREHVIDVIHRSGQPRR